MSILPTIDIIPSSRPDFNQAPSKFVCKPGLLYQASCKRAPPRRNMLTQAYAQVPAPFASPSESTSQIIIYDLTTALRYLNPPTSALKSLREPASPFPRPHLPLLPPILHSYHFPRRNYHRHTLPSCGCLISQFRHAAEHPKNYKSIIPD